ncbi:MAG: amidohydrolase family protein [Chloroflexi bacterium]|nr:amidohydrolase family protein [Chloroflexota bacterium]MCL5110098.1 amidohydrolase family protein [Chloroflexota bacterium]
MIDGMLAVDAHCHIGEFRGERFGMRRFTADDLVERMDNCGVDRALVCHLASPLVEQEDFKRANNVVVQATWQQPDRLTGVCIVNPKHGPFAQQEVRRCLEAGLKAVKLQPVLHGYYDVDSDLLEPIARRCADAGAPLFVHSDFNSKCCTPYQVARLAARYPQVNVVMLHMGLDFEMLAKVVDLARPYRNLHLDTSQTPDAPQAVFVHPVRRLGAERVLFGSDMPLLSVEVNLAKLALAQQLFGLSQDEKRQVLGGNASRLFGLA